MSDIITFSATTINCKFFSEWRGKYHTERLKCAYEIVEYSHPKICVLKVSIKNYDFSHFLIDKDGKKFTAGESGHSYTTPKEELRERFGVFQLSLYSALWEPPSIEITEKNILFEKAYAGYLKSLEKQKKDAEKTKQSFSKMFGESNVIYIEN